jgi:hypothetical protein
VASTAPPGAVSTAARGASGAARCNYRGMYSAA